MKTIICKLVGEPAIGDDVRICASASKGGRTDAPYIVREADLAGATPDEAIASIAKGLEESFQKQFSNDIATAKARRDTIYVTCSALGDDWTLFYGTAGDNKGTLRLEITDLMADA